MLNFFRKGKKFGGLKSIHELRKDELYRKVLFELTFFLHQNDVDYRNLGVSQIEGTKTKKKMEVKVYLSRPGILIGAKGKIIDGLTEHFTKIFKCKVDIRIVEFDPFIVYYDPEGSLFESVW